jgi:DNA-nicking Smr family endonuclease
MARRLGPDEKALWGRVIETVRPLHPVPVDTVMVLPKSTGVERQQSVPKNATRQKPLNTMRGTTAKAMPATAGNLDSHWDRRIHKGALIPDVSVDLHETTLSGAYVRLDRALDQAIHNRLKVVLLVTGKIRAHDRASGTGRGAIAAVVRDWLAASRHAGSISAVRQAHPRHGGAGALYIVLKR